MASRLANPFLKAAVTPLILVGLAVVDPLVLRFTLYTALAIPLQPIIWKAGWVYHDKPILLTYQASVFSACVWAASLYIVILSFMLTTRMMRKRLKTIVRD
jgi:hypothetical protein